MNQREGKRPRITRPIANRDENRWNSTQDSGTRDGFGRNSYQKTDRENRFNRNSDGDARYNRTDRPRTDRNDRPPYRGNRDNDRPQRADRFRDSGERNFNRHDGGRERFRPERDGNRIDYNEGRERNYNRRDDQRNTGRGEGRRSGGYGERDGRGYGERQGRNYADRDNRNYGERQGRTYGDRDGRSYGERGERSYGDRENRGYGNRGSRDENYNSRDSRREGQGGRRDNQGGNYRSDNYRRDDNRGRRDDRDRAYRPGGRRSSDDYESRTGREDFPVIKEDNSQYSKKKQMEYRIEHEMEETELRLNRYIAKGGLCSRRDADALILEGRVKVNGNLVQQVGVKVQRDDRVEVDGVIVIPEKKVYIILNKPKDYVTTVDDPMERKTVMSLIEGACKERVYPIGRLDRQTTGVLIFTNDGDLAKKLTHPKYNQKKIYHVFLDKVVRPGDIEAIRKGIELEDGFIQADDVQVASDDHTQVGIEIHSGKNRIVRRIFEHLGYTIHRLDRVYFAGITKKNLPRGKWRFLTSEEINMLKYY